MKNNVPIVIYRNWLAAFTSLPSTDVGEIIKALAVHVMTGETPTLPENLEIIKTQLINEVDEGLAKYFAKCAKNKQIADEREAKKQEDENERDTNVTRTCGNSKTKTKTKTKTEKETSPNGEEKKSATRFVPPSLDECQAYWKEKGFYSDPETFYNFYESKGWMVGKNKMQKWKSSAAGWETRELKEHPEIKTKKQIVEIDWMKEYGQEGAL